MKRSIIFLLCIVTVIGFMLLLRREKKQTPQPEIITEINAPSSSTISNFARQNLTNKQTPIPITTPKAEEYDLSTETEKNAKVRQMLEAQNKPVELWGKVVDQDNVPLPDVKVETSINHFFWPPEQAPNGITTNFELITDADGRFHVSDNSATGIHVTLQKAGYDQEERNGYGSDGQNGSPESPAILRMWSTNAHQKLITGGKNLEVVPDGRAYFVDLTDGTSSEQGGGDLKLWIRYTNQVVQGQLYDWSAGVEAHQRRTFGGAARRDQQWIFQ